MPNLALYTQKFKNKSGLYVQGMMTVSAVQSFIYYTPYHYAALDVSENPSVIANQHFSESAANEWLTRTRRAIAFADQSKLSPVKCPKRRSGDMIERLQKAMCVDHVTHWQSDKGTQFILNEPYDFEEDYISRLQSQGLTGFQLPIDISPYCGGWDPKQGALPKTRSFLICDSNDYDELEAILEELLKAQPLPWNSLKGVSHV